jgi:hypothetical protein
MEDFFHLPPVSTSTTLVVHLELQMYQQIFEKIRIGPNGILRGLGEIDSWKCWKSKIPWHCHLKKHGNRNQETGKKCTPFSSQLLEG